MLSAADIENRMVTAAIAGPLAQPVTYAGSPIRGVLDRRQVDTLTEVGALTRTEQVDLVVAVADVPSPAQGDAVVAGSDTYRVAGVGRDGQRAWRLSLRGPL
jgi:hypothetical protein